MNTYASFCKARHFKQTAKGLRHAYSMLLRAFDAGDVAAAEGWYLICFDCGRVAGRKSAVQS